MQSSPSALGYFPGSEVVGSVRPIPFPRPKRGRATLRAPVASILSVGLDLSFYRSESQVWQSDGCHVTRQVWHSAGYQVTPSGSALKAFDYIRKGNFDLVLISESIALCDRERLTLLVRALGSNVPIVCVTDCSSEFGAYDGSTVGKAQASVLQCIRDVLEMRVGNAERKRRPFQFDTKALSKIAL